MKWIVSLLLLIALLLAVLIRKVGRIEAEMKPGVRPIAAVVI